MSFVTGLQCRECGQDYPNQAPHVCENCFGPLEVMYDYERIAKAVSRDRIAARESNLWRYRELLPIGWGESVTDDEILEGIKLLARIEGIFTEPAGGTEVAVAKKLIESGRIPRHESIVVSITGNGYKTLEAVAQSVEKPYQINATLENFDGLYRDLNAPFAARALAS